MQAKICKACGVEKSLEEFGNVRDKKGAWKKLAKCLPCAAAYQADWKAANQDKVKASSDRARAKSREKLGLDESVKAFREQRQRTQVRTVDGGECRECARCRETKPLEGGFTRYRSESGEWKRKATCCQCLLQDSREWARKSPEKVSAQNKRRRLRLTPERKAEIALAQKINRGKRNEDPAYRESTRAHMAEYHQRRRAGQDGAQWLAARNASTVAWQRSQRGGPDGAAYAARRSAYSAARYKANKGALAAYAAEYRRKNKEKGADYLRKWRDSNRHRTALYGRTRYTLRSRAALWGASEDLEKPYAEAKELCSATGVSYHVDHVIPLNHPKVCGLHVPGNLRAVPAAVNLSKGNRIPVEVAHLFASLDTKEVFNG